MASWSEIEALYDEDASEEDEIRALQALISTGTWGLEGSMGRALMGAIEAGVCALGPERAQDYWGNVIPSRFDVEPGTKGSVAFVEAHGYAVLDTLRPTPRRGERRGASCSTDQNQREETVMLIGFNDEAYELFQDIVNRFNGYGVDITLNGETFDAVLLGADPAAEDGATIMFVRVVDGYYPAPEEVKASQIERAVVDRIQIS